MTLMDLLSSYLSVFVKTFRIFVSLSSIQRPQLNKTTWQHIGAWALDCLVSDLGKQLCNLKQSLVALVSSSVITVLTVLKLSPPNFPIISASVISDSKII